GAGYALENRTVMARLLRNAFRDGKIQRLANFFRTLQNTLAERSFQHKDAPRTVVLTPGPYNETYFEHAYLAAYLGYALVQGDDLTVVNGGVALKALSGLQPVDVILRRVDDTFCDPLELREDSWLGVAGLVEAARRQAVAIVNPLGSGILENPGMIPFMPGLARYFLGEDLLLPSAATWWCGQPNELDHVLNHLDTLVIRRIARQGQSSTLFGERLSKSERAALRARIQAEPHQYVGQEQVSFSTAPAFVNHHCEPRHTVVRTFSVADGNGYQVMPGGLARAAPAAGELFVSNSAGGISKDLWVLTKEAQPYTSLWRQVGQREQVLHSTQFLSSRSAENLFWVGRYAERAEFTARLLRTIFDYFGEDEVGESFVAGPLVGETMGASAGEITCLHQLLRSLTQVTMTYPGFVDEEGAALLADPVEELLSVVLDRARIGGLHANLAAMIDAAYAVRDLWSGDSWRVLNGLEEPWRTLAAKSSARIPRVYDELNNLITALMAFSGLNSESMTHSASWLLLDTGRRLERAQLIVAFLRATMAIRQPAEIEPLLLEMVLKTTDTIITYRRRYRSQIQPATVLDLLLLDEQNPRALGYQLAKLQGHLVALPRDPDPYQLSEEERLLLQAFTRLRLSNTTALAQPLNQFALRHTLDELMAEFTLLLSQVSDVLTRTYFTHSQTPQQLLGRNVGHVV
ncbi:MAG TPA: circularly permuted type 2 ATP-grasp protein, partial [Caldilineaceae bacterium]|nr:circularly permuted type 2 ATP-grasp protein [Caldilineaceae bacterium]